ncbi:MAG: MoaD/ThiS family protein [Thermodesulfobacteriota bacterium]
MSDAIQVNLFGSLRNPSADLNDAEKTYDLKTATPLMEFLSRLGIPADRIQLVMVNHRAADKKTTLQPGDRVALFPKEYPIFVDWNSYRF